MKILVIILGIIIIVLLGVLFFYPGAAKGPTTPTTRLGASSTAQTQ